MPHKKRRIPWNKGKKCSKETREKISKTLKGNIPWNKGKTNVYSEETLQKIRTRTKEAMNRPEIREKVLLRTREAMKDPKVRKKISIRTKKAMEDSKVKKKCSWSKGLTKETSASVKQQVESRKGYTTSEETKEKIRIKLKKYAKTPKAIQQALKNSFGTNCYYDNEFFPSLLERDCYIKLKKLGFKVEHNFEGRFDFLINNKVVAEFHPFDLAGLTDKQYYIQRRKLLDEYGYKDLKLIVIKSLNDANKNVILI